MKRFLNNLIGITGYQIKNKKYLYDPVQNLIKSMNYFKIRSVLDIGANKGQFALNLIKNNFKGDILSFEPLEKEHKILKLLSNKKKNWKIIRRCAVGKKNHQSKFNISLNRESSSLFKILPKHTNLRPDSRTVKSSLINVEKLDNFRSEIIKLKKNLLLKIDTQGSEIEVLLGAKKILKNIQCLYIEVSIIPLYKNQKLWLDVIEYLKKQNFYVWSIDQLLKNKDTGQTYQLDIFFYKK